MEDGVHGSVDGGDVGTLGGAAIGFEAAAGLGARAFSRTAITVSTVPSNVKPNAATR